MKKIILIIALSLIGTETNASICTRNSSSQTYMDTIAVCMALNATVGFLANSLSDNTTKQKIVGNMIGFVSCAPLNILMKQFVDEFNTMPLQQRNEKSDIKYNQITHGALATLGYIAGGTLGYIARSTIHKIGKGITDTFNYLTNAKDNKK